MEFQTRIFWNFYQTYCAICTNRVRPVNPGDLAIGPKDKYVEIIRKYFTDEHYDKFNQSCMRAFQKQIKRIHPKMEYKCDHLWQMEYRAQLVMTKKEYFMFSEKYWMSCKNWLIVMQAMT
jgi:hypothetical protein